MQKGQDAAGIIIINESNKVLLVHQTYGKKVWAIPGGMVDEGESAWGAAIRELKEEVSIAAVHIQLAGLYFQPHKNRYIYTFKASSYEGTIEVDKKEIDKFGFFDIEQLPHPMSSFTVQRIKDAVQSPMPVFKEEKLENYSVSN